MFDENFCIIDEAPLTFIYLDDEELKNQFEELKFDKSLVRVGNIGLSQIVIVYDKKVENIDKKLFYIQFLDKNNHNKQEGLNSYVYCDNYKDAVIDLLNSLYRGPIYIDSIDLMYIMSNKNFRFYRFIINEKIDDINLDKMFNNIKSIKDNLIFICYGDPKLSPTEVNSIVYSLKKKKEIKLWLYSFVNKKINNKDRVVSLFVEE